MSKEIMKVTPTEAIAIGDQFFRSGMFADIKSAGQAVVKIMAGAEIGIPPFAAMSGIHIIQGKPTIGAGIIASAVKGSGKYDYKVIEQTETSCSIDFYQGKEKIGNSTFTIKDAQKAGTKNIDKFPRNMLFARAISNGVKWYCPDVFSGPVYVPEELNTTEDINHEEVSGNKLITDAEEDYTFVLSVCSTLDQLKEEWGKIPMNIRPKYRTLKDDIKTQIENAAKEPA
jgi:hypothetical protein